VLQSLLCTYIYIYIRKSYRFDLRQAWVEFKNSKYNNKNKSRSNLY
jgi:hypothetical protein